MTATNHALSGALIGLAFVSPIALPVAFAAHFVMDGLPHFGFKDVMYRDKAFKRMLLIDICGCLAIVALLFLSRPNGWMLAIICAFIATSPDFMWAPGYFKKSKKLPTYGLARFHAWVQWSQTPSGVVFEALTFLILAGLLARTLFMS